MEKQIETPKTDKLRAMRKIEKLIDKVCEETGNGEVSFDVVNKRMMNIRYVVKEKTDLRLN